LKGGKESMRISFQKRGVAFFVIIGVVLILLIVSGSIIYMMLSQSRLAMNYVDATRALFIAEAGIEQALFELKSDIFHISNRGWLKLFATTNSGTRSIQTLQEIKERVEQLLPGGTLKDVVVSYELIDSVVNSKFGKLVIRAIAEYRGIRKAVEIKKNLFGINTHGSGFTPALWKTFFLKNKEYIKHFGIDADFVVYGEKAYMKDSVIELSDELVDKLCKFMDIGFGFWGGGMDLTNVAVLEGNIKKKYFEFELKKWHGIPYPSWRKTVNQYNDRVMPGKVYDKIPNLHALDTYKKIASKKFDRRHVKTIKYEAFKILGKSIRPTVFKNVVSFYGWGDWRKLKPAWWQFWKNPSKADDASKPIELNGVYFVDGDVYIEGYYRGEGAIVATGNIYIGGDLLKWGGSEEVRRKSALTLIAPNGKVMYVPHHDKDWSRYPKLTRDLDPYIEAAVYSKDGFLIKQNSSLLEKFINLTIKGNLVVEHLYRKYMSYDVKIVEDKDIQALQKPVPGDEYYDYKVHIPNTIISWRQFDI